MEDSTEVSGRSGLPLFLGL